jgi:uncharacterized protein DUF4238
VVHPHGELEVLAIERVLVVVETEPEEGLKGFGEQVNPTRVRLSGNALQDQKAIFLLDEAFRPGFPDGQECTQHIPAVGSGRQAKIGDGHDVVHMQVAEQLAFRIPAISIGHDISSFVVRWLDMKKPRQTVGALTFRAASRVTRALGWRSGGDDQSSRISGRKGVRAHYSVPFPLSCALRETIETVNSHTVPRFLLDQFAYDDSVTRSRRLWRYERGRAPFCGISTRRATRIDHYFVDPANESREAALETRLNQEFEDPVHKFLDKLSYRTFVMSRQDIRKLTRYITLLFNRSQNRRGATREQIAVAIESTRAFLADDEKIGRVAGRWTLEIIRLGHPLSRTVTREEVRRSAEQMIAIMQTEQHQQTSYIDSMERAMEFLDEPLDRGDWMILETTRDLPFVIGDAPVITWKRLANGLLTYGHGFATDDVEVILPVSSTHCLHILPLVPRTLAPRRPVPGEINRAQAAFATRACYAWKNDPALDQILRPAFGQVRIGINAFSVRHRNYDNAIFELFMSGGSSFRAPHHSMGA